MSRKTMFKKKKKVTKSVNDLVFDILSGSINNQVTIPLNLKIPKSLYETYKVVAEQYNLPLQQTLSNLASQGIQRMLSTVNESLVTKTVQPETDIQDLAKQAGLDLTKLNEGLQNIQNLAQQLNDMAEKLDDKPNS